MPGEYHCPLLEDECITVKHIIQEELNNAIAVQENYQTVATYNNTSGTEYAEYGWYCAIQYESKPVRVVEDKYYYDFDITIEGTSYDGMNAETLSVSGNLLRIRKGYWSDSTLTDWGYYLEFGVLGANIEPSEFSSCSWALVEIAPEYYGGGFGKYYFRESETTITWNVPATEPRKELKILGLNGTILGTHSVPVTTELGWTAPFTIPEQATIYKINKADHLPFAILKQLEIADFAYNFLIGFVDPLNPYLEIPRHCLNIYMSAYPRSIGEPFTLSTDEIEFIMQICTNDPGTFERPIIEVTCGCGESCPENTCPVECIDHVCCYNADGISIKEIPLSNYDG